MPPGLGAVHGHRRAGGALRLPGYDRRRAEYLACNWLPTKWDWVDPLKDANAEIAQIEAGLKSRTQAIAERGYDAEQVDARNRPRPRAREAAGPRLPSPGIARRRGRATANAEWADPNADDQNASDATQDPNPDTAPQEGG